MRIRATVGAVAGALALSALVAPMAQADTQPTPKLPDMPKAAQHFGALTPDRADGSATAPRALSAAEVPVINKVTVNSGKDIIVNGKSSKTFTVYVRGTHSTGIVDGIVYLWHGTITGVDADGDGWDDGVDGAMFPNQDYAKCTVDNVDNPATSTCKQTITAIPGLDYVSNLYMNELAGTWHIGAGVAANDGLSIYGTDYYSTHKVKRESKVTVNAAPEPVAKGKTITVTGKLTRSSWVSGTDVGYGSQNVSLQFRKYGSNTYTTLKTVKTDSVGNLKTTVTASGDGYFRYTFAGNTTSSPATAAGDYVDVK